MNICRLAILALLCFAFGVSPATAQSTAPAGMQFNVRVWETDEGLPQSTVLALAQTRDGYLWAGTLSGLARFDGMRFRVYDAGNTPALGDSRIVALFADSTGALWIGTRSAGVVVMRDGHFTAPAELAMGGAERQLRGACEDAAGNVWLYRANGELWRYDGQRFTPFVLNPHEPSESGSIIKEPNGPVWVSTDSRQVSIGADTGATIGLPVMDDLRAHGRIDMLVASRTKGYWRLGDGRIQHWITNTMQRDYGPYPWPRLIPAGVVTVTAGCEDREGNLVVGTQGAGMFVIDRATGAITALSTNEGLSHMYVMSALTDREGTLWVGTDSGGLNRIKQQAFHTLPQTRGWVVQSVASGTGDELWIASYGQGLSTWSSEGFDLLSAGQGVPPFVKTVFVDAKGQVWAGTPTSGLLRQSDGRFYPAAAAQVQAAFQDRAGRLWFGSEHGLMRVENGQVTHVTAADGLPADGITAIVENVNVDGELWVGTRRSGLLRLEGARFVPVPGGPDPLTDIAAVLFDAEGTCWVTSFANGLARYRDGKWTRYGTAEGLPHTSLGYLLESSDELWIGSNAGVLRVRKSELHELADGRRSVVQCRAYAKADGLPSAECTSGSQPGGVRDQSGRLWFPTIKGLAFLDPKELVPNTNPPPVMIEAVWRDQELMPLTSGTVTMRPGHERLEIYYVSLNLSAPERALFRYRLVGHETAWTEAGNSRVARYSKLPPGEYTFHVIACNEDGVWNETGSKLGLVVLPPIWRTWWFLTAAALLTVGLIVGVVHWISTQRLQREVAVLRQQEALEKERARIARDIHDQVGASLTQLALLGELVESDKESAPEVEAHAQQICQTARETTRALDEIVWTVNPSNDTLEGLVNYICKYAQDYLGVAGIRYRLDVPAELPPWNVPTDVRHNVFLASKEAITNVVRHARSESAWVRVRVNDSHFVVEIEDNGKGLAGMDPKAASTRHGLSNMRKRMEDVGGTFQLVAGAEGGALVRLTVPLKAA